MQRWLTREVLLIVAANLIPLVGALIGEWDAFTLIILYWLETAVLGFWIVLRVALARGEIMPGLKDQSSAPIHGGIGAGLFIAVHAGMFMAIHLFFLWSLFGDRWSGEFADPIAFIRGVFIERGLWLPLAGLFVLRGLNVGIAAKDKHGPAQEVIAFYLRIFIMQFTILAGAWVALLLGSFGALLTLGALKTAAELFSATLVGKVQHSMEQAAAEQQRRRL